MVFNGGEGCGGETDVDVQRAKVAAELLLLLKANVLEVLVAEDDDAALGDEQGELVTLLVVELRELQAADLGADDRGQLGHLEVLVVLGEEVGFLLLGDEAAVVELEGLEGREGGRLVVDGEVLGVFVLSGKSGMY